MRGGAVNELPKQGPEAAFLRGDVTGVLTPTRQSDQPSAARSSWRPPRATPAPATLPKTVVEAAESHLIVDRADLLSAPEVVRYLIEHDMLDAARVVAGDVRLMVASSRNSSLKVVCTHGPSYFVKQGCGIDGRSTIANEAAAYRWLRAHGVGSRRLHYVPRCHIHDPERALLVLDLLPDARSLTEHLVLRRRGSVAHARSLGRALGDLHRRGSDGGRVDAAFQVDRGLPSIFNVHRPTLRILRSVSRGNLDLIQLVQQFPWLAALLDDLHDGWVRDGLVHGDLKGDNCVVARTASGRRSHLAIVDWERFGIGDSAWDAGSVFSAYLGVWLQSIPMAGDRAPDHYLKLASVPLCNLQPSFGEFWANYVSARQLGDRAARRCLLRSTRYCGAALLNIARDQMRGASQLTGKTVCLIQLGFNIMQRPAEAAKHLLGIDAPCVEKTADVT